MEITKRNFYLDADDRQVVVAGVQGGLVFYSPARVYGPDFSTNHIFKAKIEDFTDAFTRLDAGTPAEITSTNTASVAENVVLAKALTADVSNVTWSLNGGADEAKFELSGSTLRWLANGTKDFDIPDDANTDNVYVVIVRATTEFGQTTDQTISVTVTDAGD